MAEGKYRAEGSQAAVYQAEDLPGFFRQWRGWGFCNRRGAGAFEKADHESCAAGAAEKRRGGGESLGEMTLVKVVRKGFLVDGICLGIENFETRQRGGGVGGVYGFDAAYPLRNNATLVTGLTANDLGGAELLSWPAARRGSKPLYA